MSQVVSCPLHVGRRPHHLALRLAHRPADAPGNLCHGWKILCHLRHEHWLPVLSWGDLSEADQRHLAFPGAAHHTERAGDGSGPPDVHGQPSGIASHCLLGELFYNDPPTPLMTSTFSEQAVREGSLDHHITGCHHCQCPRSGRQSRKKLCLKTPMLSLLKEKSSSNDKFWNVIVCPTVCKITPKLLVFNILLMPVGLFLPETAGVNLPDNLESMKTFGK